MESTLNIAVACGGTGGHIFPGLATASELLERGHEVTLWLAGKDIEHDAVSEWPGRIITIPSEGFQFGLSLRSVLTALRLYKASKLARLSMQDESPDVMLAMGSYASFGPVMAARRLGIPYVLHEANLLPGRAVALLSRRAHTVAISFEKSRFYLKHKHIVTTGMPLRRALCEACASTPRQRASGDPLRILVMGGSRGAQVLNEVVPNAIIDAAAQGVRIEVEHITGLQNNDQVSAAYEQGGIKARVHHFVQHIEEIYGRVDFVICRSGAASCAELACYALPALLVPYPLAIRDHQMSNARVLQDAGAADVVVQNDLSSTWLRDYLISIDRKPERMEKMSAAMCKRAQPDAAHRLADLLEQVAGVRE